MDIQSLFTLTCRLREILNELDKIGAEVRFEDDHISVALDDTAINVYSKSYEVEYWRKALWRWLMICLFYLLLFLHYISVWKEIDYNGSQI